MARAGAVVIDLRRSRLASLLFRPLAAILRMGAVATYDGVTLSSTASRTEHRNDTPRASRT